MRWVGLVGLAACGRIGFTPAEAPPDALGAWSQPTSVDELTTVGLDDDPSLTGDMLEIYFNSDRLTSSDIWVAKRATVDAPFEQPVAVAELNSAMSETTPEVSFDGLMLYFASNRAGGLGGHDLYVTTRATRADAWSPPVHVPALSSPSGDESPCETDAGLRIYFDSERLTGARDTIYTATRPDRGSAWSMPEIVVELDDVNEEENPYLDATGRTMWLTVRSAAGFDIYFATRESATAPFGALQLDPLSTPTNNEVDAWVSPDNRVMYFSSDRAGTYDIYRATR